MGSLSPNQEFTVVHIGDPIKYNPNVYESFTTKFHVIQPPSEQRQPAEFIKALQDRRWGDFHAVYCPFWNSGGEMGQWNEELVKHLPNTCKIFASAGAGYDWAGIPVLSKYGIYSSFLNPRMRITYSNDARASSESAFTAGSGDVERWKDAQKNRQETAYNPRGRSLGIIGLGNIGYTIAQKAWLGFGMKVLYHVIVKKGRERKGKVNATFYDRLDEMLAVSDCVVLATPFFGTKVIDGERSKQFKKGSRFVNIARGTPVDENALVDALKSGHTFAARLNVPENEPHVHSEFCKMMNVTLTCHNSGRLVMENTNALLFDGKALTPFNAHLIGKGQ
ncbi:hypothetical protein BCR34DRAFT_653493 [Clohesyomyces aquaticus]|uniref:D-isomer specific 2-hydroxyacid dehydrogenase NAD-binding domain-containing protein n=1 Tax=Clohesyomyces aquaticus TaxID=1231657 RepID=A0A1Y1ZLM5_9PLEO|nr:hypothetical protein BCR34DRAFT_653493 [Clohesyomyces aquaticus]